MNKPEILKILREVDEKLSHFDISRHELISVVMQAIAAKNNATPLHPVNAAGMNSYIEGVGALRMLLLPKDGWEIDRANNIEATTNSEKKISLVFQNVDIACADQAPKAISGKGQGAKKLLENKSRYLWNYMENEDNDKENINVWFLCVSSNIDEVRAELSLPASIEDGQFGFFKERIFILNENGQNPDDSANYNFDEDEPDIQISITKKS